MVATTIEHFNCPKDQDYNIEQFLIYILEKRDEMRKNNPTLSELLKINALANHLTDLYITCKDGTVAYLFDPRVVYAREIVNWAAS